MTLRQSVARIRLTPSRPILAPPMMIVCSESTGNSGFDSLSVASPSACRGDADHRIDLEQADQLQHRFGSRRVTHSLAGMEKLAASIEAKRTCKPWNHENGLPRRRRLSCARQPCGHPDLDGVCTNFFGSPVVPEVNKMTLTSPTGRRRVSAALPDGVVGSQELSNRILRPPLATKPFDVVDQVANAIGLQMLDQPAIRWRRAETRAQAGQTPPRSTVPDCQSQSRLARAGRARADRSGWRSKSTASARPAKVVTSSGSTIAGRCGSMRAQ